MTTRARPPIVGVVVVVPGCAVFPHPLDAAVDVGAMVVDAASFGVEVVDGEVDVEGADEEAAPHPASSNASDIPASHWR
jgi:hypothetical protein